MYALFLKKASFANSVGSLTYRVVYPLIFHDIEVEIPQEHRPVITRLYQLWLVLAATLILNMIACIFILVAGSRSNHISILIVRWTLIFGFDSLP